MKSLNPRSIVIALCAAWMGVLLVHGLYANGGPFFEVPETVFDHVLHDTPLSRQAIVMARHAEPLMPRGATLTVIAPEQAPNYDATLYLTAAGVLSRHRVMHPTLAAGEPWPDFVIALSTPLEHPGYRLVREFPEGRLYAARR